MGKIFLKSEKKNFFSYHRPESSKSYKLGWQKITKRKAKSNSLACIYSAHPLRVSRKEQFLQGGLNLALS